MKTCRNRKAARGRVDGMRMIFGGFERVAEAKA
jgi:uncharacterized protein YbaA (DUF1428 family)